MAVPPSGMTKQSWPGEQTSLALHTIMANLIQSTRSGSDWGTNELVTFNTKFNKVNAQTFFGSPDLPQITVSALIWKPHLGNYIMANGLIVTILYATEATHSLTLPSDFDIT